MAKVVIHAKHPLDVSDERKSTPLISPLAILRPGYSSEKDYIIENIGILVTAGVSITETLSVIGEDIKQRKLRKAVIGIKNNIEKGVSLWKALEESKLFPKRLTNLIRVGEETGKLSEYLSLAAIEERKEKMFISRLRSALAYPTITLVIGFIVAIGSAWYTLPQILSVLSEIDGTLPFTTRVIIAIATFIKQWGYIAFPALIIFLALFIYFIFIHKKTKVIGERIAFALPPVRKLIRGVEETRFGYILGSSLEAGVSIVQALELLSESTTLILYKRMYLSMARSVEEGSSVYRALHDYKKSKRYISSHFQHMIRAAEQSGALSKTLLKIGVIMEEKTETQSRDFSVILEPIILVFVAVIVGFIALGILSPIYNLSNFSFIV